MWFPIGGLFEPSVYLASIYLASIFWPKNYGDIGPEIYRGHEFDLLGSRDVISHVTIRLGICIFLLVVHWNYASI